MHFEPLQKNVFHRLFFVFVFVFVFLFFVRFILVILDWVYLTYDYELILMKPTDGLLKNL